MADRHTRNLFRWLDQVAADREISALGFKIAYVIAVHINRETGDAWPSQQTLAAAVGATDRGVRKAVAKLHERGHLSITSGGGRRRANRYRMIPNTRNGSSTFSAPNPELVFRVSQGKTRNTETENPERAFRKTRNPGSGEPSYRTIEEPSESLTSPADDFDRFWKAYPRKVAKNAARRAFNRIRKSDEATVDELINGASRYADERRAQDHRYTKHPATWLNGGCWADEDPPRRAPRGAVAGALGFLGDDEA